MYRKRQLEEPIHEIQMNCTQSRAIISRWPAGEDNRSQIGGGLSRVVVIRLGIVPLFSRVYSFYVRRGLN